MDDGQLSIAAGPLGEQGPGGTDVALSTTPALFTGLLVGHLRIDDAIADGGLVLSGSKAETRRFFKRFSAAG